MGVSLEGKGWGCWREASHRGKAPTRLIQAILGCSWAEALRITGSRSALPAGPDGLLGAVRSALGDLPPASLAPAIKLPSEFKPLSLRAGPFYSYFRDRDFVRDEIEWLAKAFDLHTCLRGSNWAWRIILPVRDEQSELITWTGRAVGEARIRYKTLTSDPERAGNDPVALAPISDCLLNMKRLVRGAHFLVVTEGPFDCMRLALEVQDFDAQVTCLFGKAMSPAQMDILAMIRPLYDRVFLLLDPDAGVSSLRMSAALQPLGVEPFLLEGSNDPGDLMPDEVRDLLGQMEHRAAVKRK